MQIQLLGLYLKVTDIADDKCKLLKPLREYILPADLQKQLTSAYEHIYTNSFISSAICVRSAKLLYAGHILSSSLSRSESGSCIVGHLFPSVETSSNRPHVGMVNFYFKHTIKETHNNCIEQTLAFVSWFKAHPDRDILHHPLEIWQDSFMPMGPYSFLQVTKILYPVAFTRDKIVTSFGNETVIVTVPLQHISE